MCSLYTHFAFQRRGKEVLPVVPQLSLGPTKLSKYSYLYRALWVVIPNAMGSSPCSCVGFGSLLVDLTQMLCLLCDDSGMAVVVGPEAFYHHFSSSEVKTYMCSETCYFLLYCGTSCIFKRTHRGFVKEQSCQYQICIGCAMSY